ncbi:hypothetical protein HDU93_007444, partial [Gonapodya sp. JEL0774]
MADGSPVQLYMRNRVPTRSSSLFSLPRESNDSDNAFDEDGDGDSDSDDELEGYSVHSRRPHHATHTASSSSSSSTANTMSTPPVTAKRHPSAMDTDSNGSDSPRITPYMANSHSFQFLPVGVVPLSGTGGSVHTSAHDFNHLNTSGWLTTLTQTAQDPLSLPPIGSPAKRRRLSSPHFSTTGSDIAMEDVPMPSPGLQGRTPRHTPSAYTLDVGTYFAQAVLPHGNTTASPQMDSMDTLMLSPRT